ncbi:MAG: hypothetical protein Q4G42_00470 [Neisseria sp.]|nr:hypothetical protein [Neisseria sp.]
MKSALKTVLGIAMILAAVSAHARNDRIELPIKDALNTPDAQEVLDPGVKLVFGGGGGNVIRKNLSSRQSANSVGKSDEAACNRAFLNTLKQFQTRAREMNATRVVNITTYYGNERVKSSSRFVCHAGSVIARVTMKGDIAR